jgi:glutamate decarboxylase
LETAGLAHKFRWRKWYASQHPDLTPEQITGIKPNIVISTCYQAAWEKFFRYFDMEPNFVKPNLLSSSKGAVDAKAMAEQINEKTIAVVGILGNHYNGVYDPIWDMDKEIRRVNQEKGYQVGIHVDAASGGFVAPFQGTTTVPPFDFRLESVLSMSASGHKFGESVCGTGWVVFRQRKDLAEHIAVSVSYLGGCCDSMTLNFSRPASVPFFLTISQFLE